MIAIAIIHVGFFCLFNINTYPEIARFFSSMCYLLVKKCVEVFVLPIPFSLASVRVRSAVKHLQPISISLPSVDKSTNQNKIQN